MTNNMNAKDAKKYVSDFLSAWDGGDLDYLMSFFTEESIYHNIPVDPISGLQGIREIFGAFLGLFKEANLEVLNIVGEGNTVMAERIDHFTMNDGRKIVLPVTGVFVVENAKIVRFSDYFDLASFEQQSGMKL